MHHVRHYATAARRVRSKDIRNLRRELQMLKKQDPKLTRRPRVPASGRTGLLSESFEAVNLVEGPGAPNKYAPDFELPDVVLDLDAEDSPYVRPFDQRTDGKQQRFEWARDPLLEELMQDVPLHQREFRTEADAMRRSAKRSLGRGAISDHDIFAVALMGVRDYPRPQDAEAPAASITDARAWLTMKLRAQGVPQLTLDQDPSAIIPYMLHRQQLSAQKLNPPPNEDLNVMPVRLEAHKCRNLSELRSVYAHVLNPAAAKRISLHFFDHIYKRCEELYSRENPSEAIDNSESRKLADFLKFVNNTIILQLMSDRVPHSGMLLMGLRLACRFGSMTSILQYLHICIARGIEFESYKHNLLLTTTIARDILDSLSKTDAIAVGTRQQLLKLLFGLDVEQVPQQSLLGLGTQDGELSNEEQLERHKLRLQLLGQLGALRWLERLACSREGSDEITLIDAFHRLANVTSGVEGVDVNTGRNSTVDPLWHDLQTISKIEAHHLRIAQNDSYSDSPVSTASELISSEDIIAAFQERGYLPETIRRFLAPIENRIKR